MSEKYLTTEEALNYLGITRRKYYDLKKSGILIPIKNPKAFGCRKFFYSESDLTKILNEYLDVEHNEFKKYKMPGIPKKKKKESKERLHINLSKNDLQLLTMLEEENGESFSEILSKSLRAYVYDIYVLKKDDVKKLLKELSNLNRALSNVNQIAKNLNIQAIKNIDIDAIQQYESLKETTDSLNKIKDQMKKIISISNPSN